MRSHEIPFGGGFASVFAYPHLWRLFVQTVLDRREPIAVRTKRSDEIRGQDALASFSAI